MYRVQKNTLKFLIQKCYSILLAKLYILIIQILLAFKQNKRHEHFLCIFERSKNCKSTR